MRTLEQIRADRLVTDLPVWADCPFQYSRKTLEVRRGKFEPDENEMVVIWHKTAQKHIDLPTPLDAAGFNRAKKFLLRFC